jgi:hypothetical protein
MARDRWEWSKIVLEAKVHKEVECCRRGDRLSDELALLQGIVNYGCPCSNLVALRYRCVQVVLLYILILPCIFTASC